MWRPHRSLGEYQATAEEGVRMVPTAVAAASAGCGKIR